MQDTEMDPQLREKLEVAERAIVRVGTGRGFIVEGERIITAAHCLPWISPNSELEARIYEELVGRLKEPSTASAQCLFVDPIGDIAVLEEPNPDNFPDKGYLDLLAGAAALPISASLPIGGSLGKGRVWLLSLDNQWFKCDVTLQSGLDTSLYLSNASLALLPGMSGSPILSDDGWAIGVLTLSDRKKAYTEGGLNPRIRSYLPTRLPI